MSVLGHHGLARLRRNQHGKTRAAIRTIFGPHAAVFRRQQTACNRESHAGAGAVLPRLPATIEALEEVRESVLTNADALVFAGHQQSFLVKPRSDADAAA